MGERLIVIHIVYLFSMYKCKFVAVWLINVLGLVPPVLYKLELQLKEMMLETIRGEDSSLNPI